MKDLPEFPKYLYKFISWEKKYHRKIIRSNEIFFTSPNKFNDPFDSSIPMRFDIISEEQLYEIFKFRVAQEYPNLTVSEIERVTANEIKLANIKDPHQNEKYLDYQKKIVAEKFGIFSLTKKNKNILMWSHYGDSHKGVCVRFNGKKLYDFIIKDCVMKKLVISWDYVLYQSKYPVLNPYELDERDRVLKSLLIKSSSWKYENEFRLILFNNPNKAIKFPKGSIDQIILGCNISPSNKKAIILIAAKKNIQVLQSYLKRTKYGLEYIKENV